ncbi:MAG: DUF5678 domain-containing protein [Patescibacteria group bacterium]
MKQKPIKGIEKYSNQWIALNREKTKVIVGGKSLKDVMKKAVKIDDKPVYMRVPRLDAAFAP